MPSEVTQLLNTIESGDPAAADELLPAVYEELRKLAASKMGHETPGQTLQPTALVHEARLRLVGGDHTSWYHREHFFATATAAEAMRRWAWGYSNAATGASVGRRRRFWNYSQPCRGFAWPWK
jgi:hypothetical protein